MASPSPPPINRASLAHIKPLQKGPMTALDENSFLKLLQESQPGAKFEEATVLALAEGCLQQLFDDEQATEAMLVLYLSDLRRVRALLLGLPVSSLRKTCLLEHCAVRAKGYVDALSKRKTSSALKSTTRIGNATGAKKAMRRTTSVMDVDTQLEHINKWGQVMRGPEPVVSGKDVKKIDEEKMKGRRRERKWIQMNRTWQEFAPRNRKTVKRRIRKGIPDALRASLWSTFTESQKYKDEAPSLYQSLLEKESPFADVIKRDLNRTFPEHVFFRGNTNGMAALFNVLSAYSVHDPEVGYCQGMGFLVGISLMYMDEHESFWMLNRLMCADHYRMGGLYAPGFPLLMLYLHVMKGLLREHCPQVMANMEEQGVDLITFATQWFMTLFASSLPFEVTLRIWDLFLYEGLKIVFQVGVFLIKNREKELMKADFENLMSLIRTLGQGEELTAEYLIQNALAVGVTNSILRKRFELAKKEIDDGTFSPRFTCAPVFGHLKIKV